MDRFAPGTLGGSQASGSWMFHKVPWPMFVRVGFSVNEIPEEDIA
jgi:hypothetical protein